MRSRLRAGVLAVIAGLMLTGCGRTVCCAPTPTPSPAPSVSVSSAAAVGSRKVLVIAEENHGYEQIIGDPDAPYLNQLAGTYGSATDLDAGYPPGCPSLAAYILLTSGTTAGICDDKPPKAHPLTGENLFHEIAGTGREWRAYAQGASTACALTDKGPYLVRHVPATYFLDVRADCGRWAVPLGDPNGGALHHDIAAGALPALGFISPDACHDMHGAAGCTGGRVVTGDRWLRGWLPQILAGRDYRSGRLVVIITFDEGTSRDNHIPTLVISPTTRQVSADQPFTHCSTSRLMADLLRVPPLGCAASAPGMASAFRL